MAARGHGKAGPAEVVISAATQRLVAGLFETADQGRHELKGIPTPQPLYRVTAESAAQSRFEVTVQTGLTPLAGREYELGVLRERWTQAQTGEGQYYSVARLVLANRGWSRNSKTRPATTARPGLRFHVHPITRGDGMWGKGGVSLDCFRPLAQFLSHSCRCPDGATRRSLPLPAASACLLRRRQRLGPRRSCGRERRRARLGRCRQCGKTSARRNRR